VAAPVPAARRGIVGSRGRPLGLPPLKAVRDPLRFSLFMLTILTVSRVHQHFHFIAQFRPALILAAVTAIYAYLNPRLLSVGGVFQTWPPKLVAAIAVWACLSVPFGISLGNAAKFFLDEYSKTLIYFLLLVVAIRGPRDLFTLIWAYVISSGILVYLSWFVFHVRRYSISGMERISSGLTWDANDLGLVLIIGLALAILTYQTSGKYGKMASVVVILGVGATIARSGSRGAFVGLVVVGAALLFMLKSVSVPARMGFLLATLLALAVAAPSGYWRQMGTILKPSADYNYSTVNGRVEVAKRGMGYMMSHPIFGLGLNNFQRAECFISEKAENYIIGNPLRCTPPHNSYVQAGAELGIPGLIMWTSLVFGSIIGMVRLRRRLPRSWATGDPEQRFMYLSSMYLGLAMVGFATTAFFLTFAWLDMVYFIVAMMAGLYTCVDRRLREEAIPGRVAPPPNTRLPRRRGAPVAPRFITPPQ
jgi:O-antigen ligase